MKWTLFILVIMGIALLISCDSPTEKTATYTVSGTVSQYGLPKEGAQVIVDRKANYSVLSSDDGSFQIDGIPEGDHDLVVKFTEADGTSSESINPISVYTDIILDGLILPVPVRLNQVSEITDKTLSMSWNQSSAPDFREYKLYRHTTAGLDESTGTLVYVTIDRSDTSFTDTGLNPLTTYFYRVFVMNDYGRIGGSNVESGTTLNRNFIYNGDFELNEDPTLWWIGYHYGTVVNQAQGSHSGDRALYMRADSIYAGWDCYYATVTSGQMTELEAGERYRLSLWIKTEGYSYPRWADFSIGAFGDIMAGVANYGDIGMFGIPANTDWTHVEKVFDMTENGLQQRTIQLISSSEHTWFDDIRLELIE